MNLAWGLEKIMKVAKNADILLIELRTDVIEYAKKMAEEDIQINMTMGKNGSDII